MKLTLKEKKRLAIIELWQRGDLSWKFHAGQRVINEKFNKLKGQLFVCNISRQFGKTIFSVIKAIEVALQKPNAIIRYGTAFLVDLLRFIIPAFKLIMDDCPKSIKGQYIKQGSAFIFPNGSRIDLVGIDRNPDAMRGNSLDFVCIDEASYVDRLEYLYKSVIIPSTTHRPHCKVLMVSSAPSSADHAFKEFCDKAEEEDAYCKLTIYDHPTITKETIERLTKEAGGEDSTTFRREYLCEFVTDSNLQIIPEWNDKYIQDVPNDQFYPFYHKYISQDIGYRDFTALIYGYYNFKTAQLIIEDEMQLKGPEENTETLAAKIKQKEKEMWGEPPPYRRISDNNNLNLLQDLLSIHNLSFIATNKESLQAMVNEVRIWCNAGRILINPRCENMIGCLKSGIWDAKKTIFARSKKLGHFDLLAALIYLIRNIDTHTNPIPSNYGFQSDRAWMPPITNTPQHQSFVDALLPKQLPLKVKGY